jgi:tRNA threonylcarbamoyladenosine biosynthesis protein TsaE
MEALISNSEVQTAKIAQDFLRNLKTNLVFLKGDLGAGKTAFVKGMGSELGIKRILSPTYTIMRSYTLHPEFKSDYLTLNQFHHIDLYRLNSTHDLEVLGLPEIIKDQRSLVIVEWPDMLERSLNDPRTTITIEILGQTKRRLKFYETLHR